MRSTRHALTALVFSMLVACPEDEPSRDDATTADSATIEPDTPDTQAPDTQAPDATESDAPPSDADAAPDAPQSDADTTSDVDTVTPDPDIDPSAPGTVSDFGETIAFLFAPGGPQTDVTPGAIDMARVAVVRGHVRDRAGAPLAGVTVTVLHAAELGRTQTRADGGFDIALNGGGRLVIDYTKAGYLPVQRTIDTPWRDWVHAPDIVMTPLDPTANAVVLGAAAPFQIARGSPASDTNGTRHATVLIPAGTTAELVLPDGTRTAFAGGTLRATEYTVGAAGPDAMPGQLPTASAYTYAVELSFDEALAADAQVSFATPVVLVVDNFLGYPAGTSIPVGTYDRGAGVWRPDPNGVILDVVGVTSGLADLDADGDGVADEASTLQALGITDAERAALADLDPTPASIWRTPLTHFSPIDCNWAFWLPDLALYPPEVRGFILEHGRHCPVFSSIVDCDAQTLAEAAPLTGTDLVLMYQSARTPGRKAERHVSFPLTGPALPPNDFLAIEVRGSIAGRRVFERFPPAPGRFEYTWDGKDAYGAVYDGRAVFYGVLAFVYQGRSTRAPEGVVAFGAPGIARIDATGGAFREGREVELTQRFAIPLGTRGPDARELGLGGWTLDVHHVFDPASGVVYLGSGGTFAIGASIRHVAGVDGQPLEWLAGQPVATTPLAARALHVAPDGTLHFLERIGHQVFGVDDAGVAQVVVGCASEAACSLEEGVLATAFGDADPNGVRAVTRYSMGFDGRIVFVPAHAPRSIWEVDRDGRVQRLGGSLAANQTADEPVEGALARDIELGRVNEIAVTEDGSVYFTGGAIQGFDQLWRIAPSGHLTRVAGVPRVNSSPPECDADTGLLAREQCFDDILHIAPDRQGNVYALARPGHPSFFSGGPRIIRIRPDNRYETFAGPGPASCAHDGASTPRTSLCTLYVAALRVGVDDVPLVMSLVETASDGQQHALVRLDDEARTVFGGGWSDGYGGPATMFRNPFSGQVSFAVTPDGRYVVASSNERRVLEVAEGHRLSDDRYVVVGDGARAAWVFDRGGRHLATRDVLTGATLWAFGYDSAGRVASVTDHQGGVTTFEHDPDGALSAIVAPSGARTLVVVDDDGWIERLEDPLGAAVQATYHDAEGLMASWTDERGETATFTWDELGRLVHEVTRLEGQLTLERTHFDDGGHMVEATLEGETTTYITQRFGDVVERSIVQPSGAISAVRTRADGSRELIGSDGTHGVVEVDVDPRFPLTYAARTTLTKDAVSQTYETRRTLTGGSGLFGSGVMTETTTVGARTWTIAFDGPARTVTQHTPEGRVRAQTYDAAGNLVSLGRGAGLDPITFTYTARGAIEAFAVGPYAQTFEYDDTGNLVAITHLGRRVALERDDRKRLIGVTDADGEATLGWTVDDDLASFTLPGGQPHVLESNAHGGYTLYRPPGQAAGYERVYDAAGDLERIVLPSGRAQVLSNDGAERVAAQTWPEATVTFTYPEASEAPELPATAVRTPAGGAPGEPHTTTFTWRDGQPVEVTTSGAIAGTSSVTYGIDFQPVAQTYTSGADTITHALTHDDDGRVVAFGPLTLDRSGPDRAPETITVAGATIDYHYDTTGDVVGKTVRVAGADRYALTVTNGTRRLPEARREVAAGVTRDFEYTLDATSRLLAVAEDGTEVERYAYDARGNRTAANGQPATYDGQDRLQTRAGVTYTIDADGFLAQRGADTFVYSTVGELVSATIGGETITWSYDAFRRPVKRVDAGGALELHYADLVAAHRPSAYRAPGEALTWLYYDHLDHLVAMARGDERWIVASDQIGSPRLVIAAATGEVVKERRWDAFGRLLADSAPTFVLPIGFAGGIEDAATGLVRFGVRDYEAASGRWTARDPLLVSGGQLNLYAYVGSSPVGLRDPLGLFCVGGSAYGGLGGGAKACFDKSGFSVCGELGAGVGSSLEIAPMSGVDERFFGFTGGGKIGAGDFSFGCEADYGVPLDALGTTACNIIFKPDCKFSAGPFKGSLKKAFEKGTDEAISYNPKPEQLGLPKGDEIKGQKYKGQLKAAVKLCEKAPWSLF